ncbi:DinB family protein [Flavobacterium caeni]|uniref:DinB superfamily protein n=1 Tax=Flavobacterium caeni TaxID=490189 RepID=A0A1G5CWW3_9FLAO|nr:DinB family protein [Flavobacterium caeni]SCY06690.1 DinB superfamily protein [Flavobacterium caeni]
MKTSILTSGEYAPYYKNYIDRAGEVELLDELEISVHRLIRFVREIPMDKFDYRYAPGKWTIKDILQHLIDSERIFAYRALRFARKDQTPLPSFEEDDYAREAHGSQRSIQDLLTELAVVRQATIALFKTFDDQTMGRIGTASGNPMSVRALGFVIIGHQNHHQQVFTERYL